MFDTTGREAGRSRKPETLRKLDRLNKALRHEEPDRVPISDFFWGSFVKRWRKELGLPEDANPYYHYDLDWIVTVPNMDPWIRPFETIKETPEEVVVRTGFGALMRKKHAYPMPEMTAWDTGTFEALEAAEFDPRTTPGAAMRQGTTRLRGWGTASNAIPRPGLKPCSRCTRISRCTAA